MANHLLSFVTDETGSMVSVHADLAGVELLLSELNVLRDQLLKNDCPHIHLFSPTAGRNELTESKLKDQPYEVHEVSHVKI